MATTINADNGVVSGSAGLKSTPDSSGILALQTNGTTAVTIDASQNATFAGNVVGALKSGTALAYNWNGLTTNTVLDFTGIPSTAKRITVMFNGVSTSGTNILLIQIGSTTFTTTGYLCSGASVGNAGVPAVVNSNTGFALSGGGNAASILHGNIILCNISGNVWTESGLLGRSDATGVLWSGGSLALGAVLDRVRITTIGGTDTFDAGSVNILWE